MLAADWPDPPNQHHPENPAIDLKLNQSQPIGATKIVSQRPLVNAIVGKKR
jgi:hypothetical protein